MKIMLVKICPHCDGYHFIKVGNFKFKCANCGELVYTSEMGLSRLNVNEEGK